METSAAVFNRVLKHVLIGYAYAVGVVLALFYALSVFQSLSSFSRFSYSGNVPYSAIFAGVLFLFALSVLGNLWTRNKFALVSAAPVVLVALLTGLWDLWTLIQSPPRPSMGFATETNLDRPLVEQVLMPTVEQHQASIKRSISLLMYAISAVALWAAALFMLRKRKVLQ